MTVDDVEATAGGADDAPPVFIRGVAHALPPGERLLWQGVPEPGLLARHVFHRWLIVGYFAVMTGYWVVRTVGTVEMDAFLPMLGIRLGLAVLVVGTVEFLARVIARTTVYAITSKRLVLKIGMVLPMSINIPFKRVADAAVGRFRDGSGQIALSLVPGNR
ncbi:MAG TPA: photosynthetic complex putative assembly protein PuhB, partial [Gemmatimonadaceae bacterium]|nr:photosynthetic complex putative assembly protein PuhB [Gemmatimonadaceae bacterium]